MISESDLGKIKSYLEKSQNPLFLFDDDNDGLCSFLLLREFVNRGDGLQIKTSPELNKSILNRVKGYNPDYIFILDKPLVSQDFIDGIDVPIIWIDHHEPVKRDGVKYFNPKLGDREDHSSTTYWCYKAVGGKLWVAVVGAVSDWTIPDYLEGFKKKYPALVGKKDKPEDLLFDSELGRLCRIFSFLNKEDYDELNKIINVLLKIEEPSEILEGKGEGKVILEKIGKIEKEYNELLDEALKVEKEGKLMVFLYHSSGTSFTSDLSNELLYRNPGYFIIVTREKEGKMNMSLRSSTFRVKDILERALKEVEGYGGGHLHACGVGVSKENFPKFLDVIKREVNG
ncbi:MAG: DHH family phosphoesterase [Candidatus Woesearchaeota archaeon]